MFKGLRIRGCRWCVSTTCAGLRFFLPMLVFPPRNMIYVSLRIIVVCCSAFESYRDGVEIIFLHQTSERERDGLVQSSMAAGPVITALWSHTITSLQENLREKRFRSSRAAAAFIEQDSFSVVNVCGVADIHQRRWVDEERASVLHCCHLLSSSGKHPVHLIPLLG